MHNANHKLNDLKYFSRHRSIQSLASYLNVIEAEKISSGDCKSSHRLY